jgi:hypothetical protein
MHIAGDIMFALPNTWPNKAFNKWVHIRVPWEMALHATCRLGSAIRRDRYLLSSIVPVSRGRRSHEQKWSGPWFHPQIAAPGPQTSIWALLPGIWTFLSSEVSRLSSVTCFPGSRCSFCLHFRRFNCAEAWGVTWQVGTDAESKSAQN